MNLDKEKLREYKFVLSSGCSYGMMPDVTINPFLYFYNKTIFQDYKTNFIDCDNKVISLSLNMGSQSSDWISDSIMHVCDKILGIGVQPENIYCVVEWTQWHRCNFHPFNYINLDLEKFKWRNWNTFRFHEINERKEYQSEAFTNEIFKILDISCSHICYNVGKIKDRIYVNPTHMTKNDFLKMGEDFGYFIDKGQEVEGNMMIETKIKNYLNNILKTQYFLESRNLKYNFMFMQSTLSEWKNLGDGLKKHKLSSDHGTHQYIKQDEKNLSHKIINNPNYFAVNNPLSDIEIVLPETKLEIEKINFDNVWFYESENYRRGGIDEWAIENLKETAFVKILHKQLDFKVWDILCNHNNHPNYVAYLNLWNKVTTNCNFMKVNKKFLDHMTNLYWEDYHCDGRTINYVTISKKEWLKISEQ